LESVNEFAEHMVLGIEEAKVALTKVKDEYAMYYNRRCEPALVFAPGDRVWLDGSDIATTRPSSKLSHRHLGPFVVEACVGHGAYRLKLPHHFRRCNVPHIPDIRNATYESAFPPICCLSPPFPSVTSTATFSAVVITTAAISVTTAVFAVTATAAAIIAIPSAAVTIFAITAGAVIIVTVAAIYGASAVAAIFNVAAAFTIITTVFTVSAAIVIITAAISIASTATAVFTATAAVSVSSASISDRLLHSVNSVRPWSYYPPALFPQLVMSI
jgi:hypothetical protein